MTPCPPLSLFFIERASFLLAVRRKSLMSWICLGIFDWSLWRASSLWHILGRTWARIDEGDCWWRQSFSVGLCMHEKLSLFCFACEPCMRNTTVVGYVWTGTNLEKKASVPPTWEKEDRQQATAGFPSTGLRMMACYVGPGMVEMGPLVGLEIGFTWSTNWAPKRDGIGLSSRAKLGFGQGPIEAIKRKQNSNIAW